MKRLLETRTALAAAGIVAIHLADVHSWRPALVLALALLARPRLPATARAPLAAVLGAEAATGGVLHLLHARWDGLGRTDVTGLALFAAAALFFVSASLALLGRRPLPPLRRTGRIAATVAAAVPLVVVVVLPLVSAMWLGGKPRQPLAPATFPVAHRDVELRAKDGTRLSGWYVPSRNGAAVVLVHGGGGSRNGVRRQALLLARHGYGVLLYDERGRGRSGGTNQSMGWDWGQDVEAGIDFALSQPGTTRVGLLGLSTGAEVVVSVAAHDPRVRAVVAEGVIGRTFPDTLHQRATDDIVGIPYWAVALTSLWVENGTAPPAPLTDEFRRVVPRPVLLIAARRNLPERVTARTWAHAGRPTTRLWLADAGHTAAFAAFPRLYRQRVLGLFGRALLDRP